MDLRLNSDELIRAQGSEEEAVLFLVKLVREGNLGFPYRRLYAPEPEVIFRRLVEYQPEYHNYGFRVFGYHPRYKLFLPTLFQRGHVSIYSSDHTFDTIDIITDLFFEDLRLRNPTSFQPNPLNGWHHYQTCHAVMARALRFPTIDGESLRTSVSLSTSEPVQFRSTWSKSILSLLLKNYSRPGAPRVLDLETSYGCHLMASMALNCEYLGFNPDDRYQNGYREIIRTLGTPVCHGVIPMNLLDVNPDLQIEVDIILTSFLYFQPSHLYPRITEWILEYLYRSLSKAWKLLRPGGYMALHAIDTHNCVVNEPMNLFIEQFLPESSYEGIVGIMFDHKKNYPVWIWKKNSEERRSWSPPNPKRTFRDLYPELYDRIPSVLS